MRNPYKVLLFFIYKHSRSEFCRFFIHFFHFQEVFQSFFINDMSCLIFLVIHNFVSYLFLAPINCWDLVLDQNHLELNFS